MTIRIEVTRVDLTLSGAQRTALGLGPIGSDPRDAAVRCSVSEQTDDAHRFVATFDHAFQRSATTRSVLKAALTAQARLLVAAANDPVSETAALGMRISVG